MGREPTQGDENSFCSATTLLGSTTLPFVISTEAQRSGEIRGSAVSSWKCFSTEESWAVSPPKVMKNSFCSATTLPGSTTLPFVISTEAKRSGEISVWMFCLGNVFRVFRPRPTCEENPGLKGETWATHSKFGGRSFSFRQTSPATLARVCLWLLRFRLLLFGALRFILGHILLNGEVEAAPATRATLRPNPSTMLIHNAAGQRQS